jgi:hypothetical protein
MYESLLLFKRLTATTVKNYDFANGAPAVGATLDLYHGPENFKKVYARKPRRKNLHQYFLRTKLPNIQMPGRRYFTTNDPVMTADLLDHFFNRCTHTFEDLKGREKILLHSIYNLPQYRRVLPAIPKEAADRARRREHQRYSLICPGSFSIPGNQEAETFTLRVVELSEDGFLAHSAVAIPSEVWGEAKVRLGTQEKSLTKAKVVRGSHDGTNGFYGFKLEKPDLPWRKFVSVLNAGTTHEDLHNATEFLLD